MGLYTKACVKNFMKEQWAPLEKALKMAKTHTQLEKMIKITRTLKTMSKRKKMLVKQDYKETKERALKKECPFNTKWDLNRNQWACANEVMNEPKPIK